MMLAIVRTLDKKVIEIRRGMALLA